MCHRQRAGNFRVGVLVAFALLFGRVIVHSFAIIVKTEGVMIEARKQQGNRPWLRVVCFTTCTVIATVASRVADAQAPLVIDNARVIVGDGRTFENATVIIHDKRITSVSAGEQPSVDGAARIDARGMTVMPGLIDTHVHLIQPSGVAGETAYRKYLDDVVPKNLQQYLRHGVTTVRSVGDAIDLIVELREKVGAGAIAGPRLLIVGSCISCPNGHPSATLFSQDEWASSQVCQEVSTQQNVHQVVSQLVARKVNAIKVVYDGQLRKQTDGSPVNRLSKDLMHAIIKDAHRHGLRAIVHTWAKEEVRDAVEAGADGVEHGVQTERLSDARLAELLRERNAFYVPTLQLAELFPEDFDLKVTQHNLKCMSDQGVKIALGTDSFGNAAPGKTTIRELELMVNAGLSTEQVIRAATVDAAIHVDRSDDLGTVEQGKIADLLIIDGDPLKDISEMWKIKKVIQDGVIVYETDDDRSVK